MSVSFFLLYSFKLLAKKMARFAACHNNLKIYQPVSRILYPPAGGRLSFILSRHYCRDHAAYPSASGEPPSSAGIRGITAHKVYPVDTLLQKPVSSYLTFSTLPSQALAKEGSYFLWHFLLFVTLSKSKGQIAGYSPVCCSLLSGLSSPDKSGAITRLIGDKGNFNFY